VDTLPSSLARAFAHVFIFRQAQSDARVKPKEERYPQQHLLLRQAGLLLVRLVSKPRPRAIRGRLPRSGPGHLGRGQRRPRHLVSHDCPFTLSNSQRASVSVQARHHNFALCRHGHVHPDPRFHHFPLACEQAAA
jgi:hypothetical protein